MQSESITNQIGLNSSIACSVFMGLKKTRFLFFSGVLYVLLLVSSVIPFHVLEAQKSTPGITIQDQFYMPFQAQISQTADITAPDFLASGDFNSDGRQDVVVYSSSQGRLVWYVNASNQQFGDPIIIDDRQEIQSATQLEVVDVNADGRPDIVLVLAAEGEVHFYVSDANSDFTFQQAALSTSQISAIAHGDIDRDGRQDFVLANPNSNQIEIYLQLSAGVFTQQSSLVKADDVFDLELVDVNGDNFIDLITADRDANQIFLALNNQSGSFVPSDTYATGAVSPTHIEVFDANEDSQPDVFFYGSATDSLYWAPITSGSQIGAQTALGVEIDDLSDLRIEDIDDDGDQDILLSRSTVGGGYWIENLENAIFGPLQTIETSLPSISAILSTDLNNDQDSDILLLSPEQDRVVWKQNVGGRSFPNSAREIADRADIYLPDVVLAADLNQNSRNDVLLASKDNGTIGWYPNQASNGFDSLQVIQSNVADLKGVRLFDMGNDGDLDLIVNAQSGLLWFQNEGNGNFPQTPLTGLNVANINAFAVGNFDGDAATEFVIGVDGANGLRVMESGVGYSVANTYDPFPDIAVIETIDFDDDGDLDLVVGSRNGIVALFENQGALVFAEVSRSTVASSVVSIDVADLNNDGVPDVVVADSTANTLWQMNLNNDGSFASSLALDTGASGIVQALTFNPDSDSDQDIFAVHSGSNHLVWYENSVGIFGQAQIIDDSLVTASALAIADFNGDAIGDIAAVSRTDNALNWYRNALPQNDGSNQAPVINQSFQNVLLRDRSQPISSEPMSTYFSDPENNALRYSIALSDDNNQLSATIDEEGFEVTVAQGYFGTFTVTVTADDGEDQSSFSFEVQSINDTPSVSQQPDTLFANTAWGSFVDYLDLNAVFTDINGDVLSFQSEVLTAGRLISTIDPGSNLLSLTEINSSPLDTTEVQLIAADPYGGRDTTSLVVVIQNRAPIRNQFAGLSYSLFNSTSDTTYQNILGDSFDELDANDRLSYSVQSSDTARLSADTLGGSLVVQVQSDFLGDSVQVFVQASDAYGGSVSDTLSVRMLNRAPERVASLGAGQPLVLTQGFGNQLLSSRIDTLFADPDGYGLTYTLQQQPEGVVQASLEGTGLTVNEIDQAFGPVQLIISATDSLDASLLARDTLALLVNRPPFIVEQLDQAFSQLFVYNEASGPDTLGVNVQERFSDPDGTALSYAIRPLQDSLLSAGLLQDGSIVLFESPASTAYGILQLELKATDSQDTLATATDSLRIRRNARPRVVDPGFFKPIEAPLQLLSSFQDTVLRQSIASLFEDPDQSSTLNFSISFFDSTQIRARFLPGTQLLQLEEVPDYIGATRVQIRAEEQGNSGAFVLADLHLNISSRIPTQVMPINDVLLKPSAADTLLSPPLTEVFQDPGGFTLDFEVENLSADPLFGVQVRGGQVELVQISDQEGINLVVVQAVNEFGATAQDTFAVELFNSPPALRGLAEDISIFLGWERYTDFPPLPLYFTDPDDSALDYAVTVDANTAAILNAQVRNDSLILVSVLDDTLQNGRLFLTASDGFKSITDTILVSIQNQAPQLKADNPVSAQLSLPIGFRREQSSFLLSDPFFDPEDQPLQFRTSSSDTSRLVAGISQGRILFLEQNSPSEVGEVDVQITATDPYGDSAIFEFTVFLTNQAPQRSATVEVPYVVELVEGWQGATLDELNFDQVFEDADGHDLSYSLQNVNQQHLLAAIQDNQIVLNEVDGFVGTSIFNLVATDIGGLEALLPIEVRVTAANQSPVLVDNQADTVVFIRASDAAYTVDLSQYFEDPDGDSLAFDIQPSNSLFDFELDNTALVLSALENSTSGISELQITATDGSLEVSRSLWIWLRLPAVSIIYPRQDVSAQQVRRAVDVAWTPVEGAVSYQVQVYGLTSGVRTLVFSDLEVDPSLTTTQTTPLNYGQSYVLELTATDQANLSGPLAQRSFRVVDAPSVPLTGQTQLSASPALTQQSYRLLGLPGQYEPLDAAQIFEATNTSNTWTVYDYDSQSQRFVGYNANNPLRFRPGRALWYLSEQSVMPEYEAEAPQLNAQDNFEISIQSGWNLISSVFADETMDWSIIQSYNAIEQPLWSFDLEWLQAQTFEAYEGYYLFSDRAYTLRIPYGQRPANEQDGAAKTQERPYASLYLTDDSFEYDSFGLQLYTQVIDQRRWPMPDPEFSSRALWIRAENRQTESDWDQPYWKGQWSQQEGGLLHTNIGYKSDIKSWLTLDLSALSVAMPDLTHALLLLKERSRMLKAAVQPNGKVQFELPIGSDYAQLWLGTEASIAQKEMDLLPKSFAIEAIYPNPFNPATTIQYSLPEVANIRIQVFDVMGRQVATLFDGSQQAGQHRIQWQADSLPSGLYLLRISAPSLSQQLVRKITLIK